MKAGAEEVLQQLALPKRRGTSRIGQAACPCPSAHHLPPPAGTERGWSSRDAARNGHSQHPTTPRGQSYLPAAPAQGSYCFACSREASLLTVKNHPVTANPLSSGRAAKE